MRIFVLVLVLHSMVTGVGIGESKADPKAVRERYYTAKQGLQTIIELPQDRVLLTSRIVIIDSLIIPKGDSLSVNAPTTMFLEPQGRIIVEGKLIAHGTTTLPVTFTVLPYAQCFEKAFDDSKQDTLWQGIHIRNGGQVILDTVIISNATEGIITQPGQGEIHATCLTFTGITNRRYFSEIFSESQYSFICLNTKSPTIALSKKNTVVSINQTNEKHLKQKPLVLASAGICVLGVAGYFIFRNLEHTSDADAAVEQDKAKAYQLQDNRDFALIMKWASLGTSMSGLLVMGLRWKIDF